MPVIKPLTVLALFQAVQYEIHKVEAPSFDLEEFNHFVNRTQLEYANLRYNLFEATQQLTDDLRALKREFTYTANSAPVLFPGTQTVELPEDYWHTERVKVTFTVAEPFGCYRADDTLDKTAKRLPADLQGYVEQPNFYARPDYRRPYWRLLQNTLEIKSGQHARLVLTAIELEYLCVPTEVKLFQSDVDDPTNDVSMLMDWPAYVCNELAKLLVKLFLENTSSARLQTYPLVSQSIPSGLGAPSAPAGGGQAGGPGSASASSSGD